MPPTPGIALGLGYRWFQSVGHCYYYRGDGRVQALRASAKSSDNIEEQNPDDSWVLIRPEVSTCSSDYLIWVAGPTKGSQAISIEHTASSAHTRSAPPAQQQRRDRTTGAKIPPRGAIRIRIRIRIRIPLHAYGYPSTPSTHPSPPGLGSPVCHIRGLAKPESRHASRLHG